MSESQTIPPPVLPAGNDGVRAFLEIFARHPSRALIANLNTRLEAVAVPDGALLPVSVNDGSDVANCYVCSPQTQYREYASYELSHLGRPLLEVPLQGLLAAAGQVFRRAVLDRVVIVNNWLLSTNLYPVAWRGEGLKELLAGLTGRYPQHAVLFRSLNARQNPALLAEMQRISARLLASRIVWHYDGADASYTKTSDCRRDFRLLETGPWEVVRDIDPAPADTDAFAALYRQLYLEKYTLLNPQYTALYFAECYKHGLLRFHGLRDRATGRWLGVVGIFERDGVLTAPVVGYDRTLPQKFGLYRALMAIVLRLAAERRTLLNLSAGAGRFKQLRGGEPCVEYTAVFDAHLSWKRRWPWDVVEVLSNRLGRPMAWRKEVGA